MTSDPDLNMATETYRELVSGGLTHLREPERMAAKWMRQEDRGEYVIGCPDRSGRRAMIVAVELSGAIAGMDYPRARGLMRKLDEYLEDAEHAEDMKPWE